MGDTRQHPCLAVRAVVALAAAVGFAAAGPAMPAGAASPLSFAETPASEGRTLVTLESDLYRLVFDPARGGRCSSFVLKASGREWVYDGSHAGLFLDHFAHQYWPGELLSAAYQWRVEPQGEESLALRLWTVPQGDDPLTRGMQVEKIITLRPGRREVEVTNSFANGTSEGKNVALWVQQCFSLGGDRLYDQYYRPALGGISLDGKDDKGERTYPPAVDEYLQDWVKQPAAGWTAVRDRRTNEGAVFLLDFNYLSILYNCASSYTTEWFMDKVPVPPGKTWSTRYSIVPVDGFRGFAHASARLLANVEVAAEGGGTGITHQLAGTTAALGQVTVNAKLYGIRSKQEVALPSVSAPSIGLEPVELTQQWEKPQTEPLVVRVEVAGEGWTERYEYVHYGEYASAGIAGAPTVAEYTVPVLAKQKVFLKPDTWPKPHNAHLRALVIYGIWSQHYRIAQALRRVDREAEITVVDGWDFFPATYDEVLKYDLIVLSDVPAGPDYANEMVVDFVQHGGSLLTLGGMLTYGSGQWGGTRLADVLPVALTGGFDLKWERAGVAPRMLPGPLESQGWPPGARFWWLHEAIPKPGSTVAATAGKRPLIVLGAYGEGRVATCLGTCHGEPSAGQVPAWTCPEWTQTLTRTVAYLKERQAQ